MQKVSVAVARQLSLYESQFYGWRKTVKKDAKISNSRDNGEDVIRKL
ncbi:hypothetical protein VCRA2110O318_150029 [Vibrio crassostreae]|nr:hypothetical protein VCRA2117O328_150073 [Vibrio crassostreae]CAK2276224.1 hypothetical protein VCRA2110O318_150029 [Vibrio crassostreae]CAK2412722.1 hypothetical protein VCRA2110O319_140073 [Vibrio crassostreae]CAK2646311.1 hypothetical protein VCRA217O317_150030 [Vibrio crassostreae]